MFEVDGGYRDRERWDDVHSELSEVMAQLERATQPYLREARKAAEKAKEET
jgi:hypothetical protein